LHQRIHILCGDTICKRKLASETQQRSDEQLFPRLANIYRYTKICSLHQWHMIEDTSLPDGCSIIKLNSVKNIDLGFEYDLKRTTISFNYLKKRMSLLCEIPLSYRISSSYENIPAINMHLIMQPKLSMEANPSFLKFNLLFSAHVTGKAELDLTVLFLVEMEIKNNSIFTGRKLQRNLKCTLLPLIDHHSDDNTINMNAYNVLEIYYLFRRYRKTRTHSDQYWTFTSNKVSRPSYNLLKNRINEYIKRFGQYVIEFLCFWLIVWTFTPIIKMIFLFNKITQNFFSFFFDGLFIFFVGFFLKFQYEKFF